MRLFGKKDSILDAKYYELDKYIELFASDNVISDSEYQQLLQIDENISKEEVDSRIHSFYHEKMKSVVMNELGLDKKLSKKELKRIRQTSDLLHISEFELNAIINEVLTEVEKKRQEKKEKILKTTAVVATTVVASAAAALVGIAKVLNEDDKSSATSSNNVSPNPTPKAVKAHIVPEEKDPIVEVNFYFKVKGFLGWTRKRCSVSMRKSEYLALLRGSDKNRKNYIINHSGKFDLGVVEALNVENLDQVSVELNSR